MVSVAEWLTSRGRPVRRRLALTVALGELTGILLLAQTALLVEIGNGAIFHHRSLASLAPYFAGILAVVAVRALVTWIARSAAFSCASEVKQSVRADLVARLAEMGPIALANQRAGELATTAVDGVEAIDGYFSKYLPQRAVASLLPLSILAVVLPLDWISGVILIATAVFLPLTMIVIGEEAHERNRRLWGRLSQMSAHFLDALRGLPTLKMFGAERREVAAVAATSDAYRRASMEVMRIAFLSSFMLELISTVSIAIVAVVSGVRMLAGSLSFAPGYFILLAAPEYFLSLRTLGTYYHTRMEAVSAAERLFELLSGAIPQDDPPGGAGARGSSAGGGDATSDTPSGYGAAAAPGAPAGSGARASSSAPPAIAGPSAADLARSALRGAGHAAAEPSPDAEWGRSRSPAAGGASSSPAPFALVLRELFFSFPGRAVLTGASLELAPGEHVVLVGPSGTGKSTLLHLLLGFIRAESGSILADGHPLEELDRAAWLARIAWLPQRPTLFHGTVAENIEVGRLGASREAIREAARRAYADEFIERLPRGYESRVGELGEGLSGGQIQRVALARLFLRDPALVLLDEPTAHLDAESERLVDAGIAALTAKRSLLYVTHRTGGEGRFDRLVALQGGRLAELPSSNRGVGP